MGSLVEHARIWGGMKHKGQVRKYTGEPYFTHCEAVAERVSDFINEHPEYFPNAEEVITAALLHDVVEDTDATFDDIIEYFGEMTAKYVYYLTKPPEFAGNREQRKTIFNSKLALAPLEVKVIKFFDVMHNAPSIKEHDPEFWKQWSGEARRFLLAIEAHNIDNLNQYLNEDLR